MVKWQTDRQTNKNAKVDKNYIIHCHSISKTTIPQLSHFDNISVVFFLLLLFFLFKNIVFSLHTWNPFHSIHYLEGKWACMLFAADSSNDHVMDWLPIYSVKFPSVYPFCVVITWPSIWHNLKLYEDSLCNMLDQLTFSIVFYMDPV